MLRQKFTNQPETQNNANKLLEGFEKPALPSTASFRDFKEKIPQFVVGKDVATGTLWKSVLYPINKNFSEAPNLMVRASHVNKKFIDIKIPKFPMPPYKRLDIFGKQEDWNSNFKNACKEQAVTTLGDWDGFNWMRNILVNVFGAVGWVIGGVFQFFYNTIFIRQMDEVEVKLNQAFTEAYHLVEDKAEEIRSTMNNYIDKLTEMWKMPDGVAPVVIEIRNENRNGFQWKPQEAGQELFFIAYGPRS